MQVWCGNYRTKKTLPTEISKGGNILKEQCVTCFFYFEAMPKMRQIFIILYLIQRVETGKPTDKRNDNKIGYFVMLDPPYLFFLNFLIICRPIIEEPGWRWQIVRSVGAMVLREVRFLGYRRNLDKVGSLINDGTVNQDVSRMEGVCFVYKNSSMTKVLGGSTILRQVGVMSISPTGAK